MHTGYISHLHIFANRPEFSVTQVTYREHEGQTFVRPISKDYGWVKYGGKIHETYLAAVASLISDSDVLLAKLENVRELLVRQVYGKKSGSD